MSVGAVERRLARERGIRIVSMTGSDIAGVWDDIRAIAEACGASDAAEDLIHALEARRVRVEGIQRGAP